MIPTISNVTTLEEWRVVTKDIVTREGELSYHASIVDWSGLGYLERPSLNYNAYVMENFLVQPINSPSSHVADADALDITAFGDALLLLDEDKSKEATYYTCGNVGFLHSCLDGKSRP